MPWYRVGVHVHTEEPLEPGAVDPASLALGIRRGLGLDAVTIDAMSVVPHSVADDCDTCARRRDEAIDGIRRAITLEGPAPVLHRRIMRRHRNEWPTLWAHIDALLDVTEGHT